MSEIAIHQGEPVRSPEQNPGAPAQAHGLDANEHSHGHHGPAHLHHHFTDVAQQRESNALGMWVFMVTEVMTFGALFFVYTLYRHLFDTAAFQSGFVSPFATGSHLLNHTLGFINTLVLLVSSLTMAGAVHNAVIKNRKWMIRLLCITWMLGLAFLVIKGFEWAADYQEGLVPALNWNPAETLEHHGYVLATVDGINGGAVFQGARPTGAGFEGIVNGMQMQMFFVIYFCLAGLHAIHMIIGLGLVGTYIRHASVGIFDKGNDQPVEILGLYWHFVDIVWVFLYPLLYLIAH